MKLKLLVKMATMDGLRAVGDVIEWPDDTARELIEKGYGLPATGLGETPAARGLQPDAKE